ncbi:MAG: DUF4276 family protein [Helicobacteraceae bacterium]|jgi:hypothetical protein|nr:DUF4276 family protein [Helicobacteraceae bacterium]
MHKRLAISVEGQTEQEFCEVVLKPYFQEKCIDIQPIVITTKRLNNGKKYRGGGNIGLQNVAKEVNRLLNSFDYVTTMYDYYGFKESAGRTVEQIEAEMRHHFNSQKFIPYIQKHEFETLLFSSPAICAEKIGESALAKDMQKVIDEFGDDIDSINNSETGAPSKRICDLFSNYGRRYNKIYYARVIAKDIGLDALRSSSNHFDEWIAEILKLSNC